MNDKKNQIAPSIKKAACGIANLLEEANNGRAEDTIQIYKETKKQIDETLNALSESCAALKKEVEQLNAVSADALQSIRGKRFALLSETSEALKALREVRQFFLGSDYELECQRLESFADLCERLLALKKSGFLDLIGDTILRLAIGTEQP